MISNKTFKHLDEAEKWILQNPRNKVIGFQEVITEDESGYWDSHYLIWYLS